MIVLVAHGTRDPSGAVVTERLATRVRSRARTVPVRVAYADVRGPDVMTVLRGCVRPTVVVPAFLASGYHVRTDIPAQIADSGHDRVRMSEPFGGARELVALLVTRLRQAGYRHGDRVVLAAAGSSDPDARAEVRLVAARLGRELDTPVRVGYAATARPSVADAVADARLGGYRVAVASWLLAPGLFQQRLTDSGADVVAGPLGAADNVAELVLRRYAETAPRAGAPLGGA